MRRIAASAALCALLASVPVMAMQPPATTVQHPLRAAQPDEVPDAALLFVEISAGSAVKYETDANGLLFVDRFLAMPVAYPANYGSLPRTLAGDGDPLDALVLTRTPVQPGVLLRFRPIGVLRMTDHGEADAKIIGVPVDAVDPTYRDIRDIADLPEIERARIEAFFRVYKQLPQGTHAVRLSGFGDASEAREVLRQSLQRFDGRE